MAKPSTKLLLAMFALLIIALFAAQHFLAVAGPSVVLIEAHEHAEGKAVLSGFEPNSQVKWALKDSTGEYLTSIQTVFADDQGYIQLTLPRLDRGKYILEVTDAAGQTYQFLFEVKPYCEANLQYNPIQYVPYARLTLKLQDYKTGAPLSADKITLKFTAPESGLHYEFNSSALGVYELRIYVPYPMRVSGVVEPYVEGYEVDPVQFDIQVKNPMITIQHSLSPTETVGEKEIIIRLLTTDNQLIDADVKVVVRDPMGFEKPVEVVRITKGTYKAIINFDKPGSYYVKITVTKPGYEPVMEEVPVNVVQPENPIVATLKALVVNPLAGIVVALIAALLVTKLLGRRRRASATVGTIPVY